MFYFDSQYIYDSSSFSRAGYIISFCEISLPRNAEQSYKLTKINENITLICLCVL